MDADYQHPNWNGLGHLIDVGVLDTDGVTLDDVWGDDDAISRIAVVASTPLRGWTHHSRRLRQVVRCRKARLRR